MEMKTSGSREPSYFSVAVKTPSGLPAAGAGF